MFKNIFILCSILLFPLTAIARPTIAILNFDIEKNAIVVTNNFIATGTVEDRTKMLSSELVTFLVNTRKFDVIERDRINSILIEQEFSSSGMVDAQSAIQMGKLIGTDYMVMGKVEVVRAIQQSKAIPYTDYVKHTTTGDMIVNMRIVDTRTGKIVSAKKVKTHTAFDGNQAAEVFLDQLKEDTVRKMVVEVIDGVFPIKVVGISGNSIFLNRGAGAANFAIGDHLNIYQMGEDLIDPDTGESLGSAETKIAEIIIASIQSKKSVANIVNITGDSIPIGSICRKPVRLLMNSTPNNGGAQPVRQQQQVPKW